MSDEFEQTNFRSLEAMMQFLREKSDDIDAVTVPVAPTLVITDPDGKKRLAPDCGGYISFINGERVMLHREDMQMLINDGVLQRMNIPVVLDPE